MAQLDNAQLIALRDDITVTHAAEMYEGKTLLEWWNTNNNDQEISEWYRLLASPEILVWREDLMRPEINEAVLYSELLTLGATELQVYALMLDSNGGSLNAASQNVRDGIADILSGPLRATSRNNMIAVGQRPGTNSEVLFVTPVDGAFVSAIYGDRITNANVTASRTA